MDTGRNVINIPLRQVKFGPQKSPSSGHQNLSSSFEAVSNLTITFIIVVSMVVLIYFETSSVINLKNILPGLRFEHSFLLCVLVSYQYTNYQTKYNIEIRSSMFPLFAIFLRI